MPYKDFTPEDIIHICTEISKTDNIYVKSLRKKSIFRHISSESDVQATGKKSLIGRKISLANGIPSVEGESPNQESPTIERKTNFRKFSVDSSLSQKKTLQKPENENIAGLNGRKVIAVAILCDKSGSPIKTYTEDQDIPEEEVKSAGNIFFSRIPALPEEGKKTSTRKLSLPLFGDKNDSNSSSEEIFRRFSDVLEDLDANQRQKLLKRLDCGLMKLHTTDLNTALSFLKTERYAKVRQELKAEMIVFATKDLKMVPYL